MKKLKLATINLYNLQYKGLKTYGKKKVSEQSYNGKVAWTARLLQQLDADIIGFQELWDNRALIAAFEAAGLSDQYELITRSTTGVASVALAVRRPLDAIHSKWVKALPKDLKLKKSRKSFSGEPDYDIDVRIKNFSRPLLRVNIKYDDDINIICFVAHLKSKLPMRLNREPHYKMIKPHVAAIGSALSTIKRASEAAAIRVILNKEMKNNDKPVIVMGDLNDAQLSVTTSLITGNPKFRLFQDSGTGNRSDNGLYSVATLQELRSLRDVYYTYIHNGFRESLDHILVSEQFYDYSKNRIWSFMETRIINDHIDDRDGIDHGSDHGVVISTFNFDPNDD